MTRASAPPGNLPHLVPDQLEAYVLGLSAASASEELERHVARCSDCAAALAAEARRESALQTFVPRLARPERRPAAPERWRSPFLLASAGALALLLVAIGTASTQPSNPRQTGGGQDEASALLCLADGESVSCPLPHAPAGEAMTPSWAGLCAAPEHCPLQSRRHP